MPLSNVWHVAGGVILSGCAAPALGNLKCISTDAKALVRQNATRLKLTEREHLPGILAVLHEMPLVQHLDLERMCISAKALMLPAGLTMLKLRDNGIGTEGASALTLPAGLTALDLSSNGIGAEGAWALTLPAGLTMLNLCNNGIGTEGLWALTLPAGLTALDLSDNGIRAEGAWALTLPDGLTMLELESNYYRYAGICGCSRYADIWDVGCGYNRYAGIWDDYIYNL